MPRVVTPKEFLDLAFPLAGVDASAEFWRQAQLTTAFAKNVRGEEPVGQMRRGGSRMGLLRFIDERVNGDSVIQHLNVVVDPQAPGLNADGDEQLPGYIPDPSTNNLTDRGSTDRYVPPFGSGRPPNRNIPGGGAQAVAFVSKYRTQPGVINAPFTVTLPAQPENQAVILVYVRTEKAGTVHEAPASVTNATLNAYTQVGGSGYTAAAVSNLGADFANTLSCWWKQADQGAQDTDVRITPAGSGYIYEVVVLVYRGASPTSPVSAFARASLASPSTTNTPVVTGLVLNNTAGQAAVCCLFAPSTSHTATGSGYTGRYPVSLGGDAANVAVVDKVGLSGVGPEAPQTTVTTARPYIGLAVALTH